MSFALTAEQLRAIAEAADGKRNDTYFIVANATGFEVRSSAPNPVPADTVVIPVHTDDEVKPADRKEIVELYVEREDKLGTLTKLSDLTGQPEKCDALFWTESAVEKFAVPYRARKNPRAVDRMLRDYNKDTVYALGHIPKSEYIYTSTTQLLQAREDDGLRALVVNPATQKLEFIPI